jgi:hypothetical protein
MSHSRFAMLLGCYDGEKTIVDKRLYTKVNRARNVTTQGHNDWVMTRVMERSW